MSMLAQNDLSKARIRSVFLTLLMVLSTTAALATTASASVARTYTTNRDPMDVAIGDFDCDGFNDMAIATDGTHTMTILYNDGFGNFNDREDIWVAGNQSRNADWDEFANVEQVEVGEFTGDNAIDIVIYQKNNPFKTNDQGAPAGEPGNVTIIENGGCNNRDWSIGARFTHFWVWDMTVADADQDGNDDIFVLELEEDISRQNVVTYRSPITSATQGVPTFLGLASQFTYRTIEAGDFGESQSTPTGSCTDDDIFLLRTEGIDYATGQTTNPGNGDNVTIIEYSCTGNSLNPGAYPADITTTTNQPTIINFGLEFSEDFAIADIGGNGYIDTIAMMDSNLENVTYKEATAQGTFGATQRLTLGPTFRGPSMLQISTVMANPISSTQPLLTKSTPLTLREEALRTSSCRSPPPYRSPCPTGTAAMSVHSPIQPVADHLLWPSDNFRAVQARHWISLSATPSTTLADGETTLDGRVSTTRSPSLKWTTRISP